MITKGTIWTSPTGEICEWLRDMNEDDPITADSMLLNGNPCLAGQNIPLWMQHPKRAWWDSGVRIDPPEGVTVTHGVCDGFKSSKDEIARIEQLRERAFAATIADEADFARRWSQYHHALQAAYERGALVAAP